MRLLVGSHFGIASFELRPAHGLTDGDTIFGLSTEQMPLSGDDRALIRSETSRAALLAPVLAAAADVFALACTDAIVHARQVGDAPAYLTLCPSAART